MSEPARSRQARDLAEASLVRIVRGYGTVPEFVLIGGLVPDLLCSRSDQLHVGTTDIDVQVDLEIANGSANARRLEEALRGAGFTADAERGWRWQDRTAPGLVVRAEFLSDLDDVANHTAVTFDECQDLGALNLRGTGFAARHWGIRRLSTDIHGVTANAALRVAALPGYLLAKTHAAYGRQATKDWYDIAYVVLHNDLGGPTAAGQRVAERFGAELAGQTRTALDELAANFAGPSSQGAVAYAEAMLGGHPGLDWDLLVNDAVAAIDQFTTVVGRA
jgi:hypothetical protein